jgi:hypothetical protein
MRKFIACYEDMIATCSSISDTDDHESLYANQKHANEA